MPTTALFHIHYGGVSDKHDCHDYVQVFNDGKSLGCQSFRDNFKVIIVSSGRYTLQQPNVYLLCQAFLSLWCQAQLICCSYRKIVKWYSSHISFPSLCLEYLNFLGLYCCSLSNLQHSRFMLNIYPTDGIFQFSYSQVELRLPIPTSFLPVPDHVYHHLRERVQIQLLQLLQCAMQAHKRIVNLIGFHWRFSHSLLQRGSNTSKSWTQLTSAIRSRRYKVDPHLPACNGYWTESMHA